MNKKTAVLIHGLHLQANEWERLVWGDLKNSIIGNIPRGIKLAIENNADLIYFGSGASEKNGKKESEVTLESAKSRLEELASYVDMEEQALQEILDKKSYCDTVAKDTKEEINNFLDLCLEKNITNVIFVPFASQAPIAMRRVLAAVLENPKYFKFKDSFQVIPSDTRYKDVTMNDIVIFTPPHRGDRLANPSHLLARKTLDVIQRQSRSQDKEALQRFLSEWENLLNKYST